MEEGGKSCASRCFLRRECSPRRPPRGDLSRREWRNHLQFLQVTSRESLARAGATPLDGYARWGMFGDLLAREPDVDAVFCNNKDIALGVLLECQRRRIEAPAGGAGTGTSSVGFR